MSTSLRYQPPMRDQAREDLIDLYTYRAQNRIGLFDGIPQPPDPVEHMLTRCKGCYLFFRAQVKVHCRTLEYCCKRCWGVSHRQRIKGNHLRKPQGKAATRRGC